MNLTVTIVFIKNLHSNLKLIVSPPIYNPFNVIETNRCTVEGTYQHNEVSSTQAQPTGVCAVAAHMLHWSSF